MGTLIFGARAFPAPSASCASASRSGNACARAGAKGFTLIEIMVVLLILGLCIGLVSAITRPGEKAALDLEAERLAQLLDLAGTESRLTGKRIAWTAEPSGYRFWRASGEADWMEVRDVDALRPRTLPQGISIASLTVENGTATSPLRLEFASSGSATSFTIDLVAEQARVSVEGTPVGEVRILSGKGPNGRALPQ